jgi:hypothetical protein
MLMRKVVSTVARIGTRVPVRLPSAAQYHTSQVAASNFHPLAQVNSWSLPEGGTAINGFVINVSLFVTLCSTKTLRITMRKPFLISPWRTSKEYVEFPYSNLVSIPGPISSAETSFLLSPGGNDSQSVPKELPPSRDHPFVGPCAEAVRGLAALGRHAKGNFDLCPLLEQILSC